MSDMDNVLAAMRNANFKPKPVNDEDFPAVKGEYVVEVKALKPWINKTSGEKEAYMLELKVTETLSGDMANNRNFSRFYRIAGTKREWDKSGQSKDVPIGADDMIEAIKNLASDVFTLNGAPELDLSSTEALEASFAAVVGKQGFMRAWHFPSRDDKDKLVQQWTLKQGKHLGKDAKAGAEKSKALGF